MKPTKGSQPVCWWCHASVQLDAANRGSDNTLGLPTGSGVVVCSPACPERPDGAKVYKHPAWRTAK